MSRSDDMRDHDAGVLLLNVMTKTQNPDVARQIFQAASLRLDGVQKGSRRTHMSHARASTAQNAS
jgi:hypothetical protein